MLKRLRLKIVACIMGISFAVLALAFFAVMAIASASSQLPLQRELRNALTLGADGTLSFVIGYRGAGPADGTRANISVPVAVVVLDRDCEPVACNDAFLTSMDDTMRLVAVERALASSEDSGLISDVGVLFRRETDGQGWVLAFVDASGFLASMRGTAVGTLAVFATALAALFALSLFLARVITRPVQQAWDSQAQFVADASHELKTPLTVVLANADILASRPELLDADQTKWLTGIRIEAQRMKKLVEEMLFLARNENAQERQAVEREEFDLSHLVRQACLSFDAVAFESGAALEDHVTEGMRACGNREQVERLVKSLMDNAVKYAGAGGVVVVRLSPGKKGRPVFSVTNSGDPIPAQDLPHVFDRFWRSDTARGASPEGGYGLGLSIAQSIARTQGASISVTSTAEAGTTFTVQF